MIQEDLQIFEVPDEPHSQRSKQRPQKNPKQTSSTGRRQQRKREDESEMKKTPFVPRRSGRILKPTLVGLESAANICWSLVTAPVTTKQAAADPNWQAAMKKEVQSLTTLVPSKWLPVLRTSKSSLRAGYTRRKKQRKAKIATRPASSLKDSSRYMVSTMTKHGPLPRDQIQFAFLLLFPLEIAQNYA